MQNNSIKAHLSKEDIISDIRMSLNADILKEVSALVVEGEDDLTFFTGKITSDVYLYESFSGKQGVTEIMGFFTDNRVIGIQDRDYLHVPQHSNIHFYDYNSLEMMMVADISAFENFCYTLYQGHYTPLELREIIMKDLAPLSCYRKLNDQHSWGINFDGINFGNLCPPTTGRLDYVLLVKQIKQINPQRVSEIQSQWEAAVNLSLDLSSLDDYLTITRGHDFLFYFHQICNHSKTRQVSLPKAKELGRTLQCAYRFSDFKESKLYQDISSEQSAYNRTVFKV